jgi:hypothetical protein
LSQELTGVKVTFIHYRNTASEMTSTSGNTAVSITEADIDELVSLIIMLPKPDDSKKSPGKNIWKLHAVAATWSEENEWWDNIERYRSHVTDEGRATLQRLRRNYNAIRKLQRLSQEVSDEQNFTPSKHESLHLTPPSVKRQRLSHVVFDNQKSTPPNQECLSITPSPLENELSPSTYINSPMQCGQSPTQEIQSLAEFGIKLTEQQEESLHTVQNQLQEQDERLHILRMNYMNEVENLKMHSAVQCRLF